jgi:hypothetical protein
MALPNEAGRCSVRVVRDRGGPSGSPSARSRLLMVDATTTPNADSVALAVGPGALCSWSPRYAHWRPGAVHGWPSPTAMGSRRGDRRRTAVGCSVDDQLGRVGPSRASVLQRQSAASTTAERGTLLRVRSLRKSPHDVSCRSVPRRVASVGAMADSRGLGCLSRELGGIATTSFVGHCDAGRRSPRAVVFRRARTAASATWPVGRTVHETSGGAG